MSYMRYPIYAWSDGVPIHLWPCRGAEECGVLDDPDSYDRDGGIHMDEKLWDELVVARYAELLQGGLLKKTVRRMRRKDSHFRGNGGGMAFFELLGEDPLEEFRKQAGVKRKESHHYG